MNYYQRSLLNYFPQFEQSWKDTHPLAQHVSCQWFLFWCCGHSESWKAVYFIKQNVSLNLEILRTLSKELKWWTSWCNPYIPFWCTGRPVRILDLLGEQLLTKHNIFFHYCGFHSNLSWCVCMLKYCPLRGKFVQMRGFYESVPEGSNLMSLFKTFKNQTIFTSSPASSAMINKTFFVQWQTFQYIRNNKIINIFYFLLTVVVNNLSS